ncbi:MAG: YaiI/YqxD family protein [Firmicutes bacterium HGW-Firmicutes-15]|nr:MAG: YaiI/YqxD family protein [Firmicutes bacterium HGW-Firmicutes-15]
MKILVDADACPVKDIIEKVAKKYRLELVLVSNINHLIESAYGEVVVVDGASQAADMAIINRTLTGDIVITQDYGLASIALAKGGLALHPLGKQYTEDNIDGLLMQRYINNKVRKAGGRIHGPHKRIAADNSLFEERLTAIINNYAGERKSLE